MDIGGAGCSIHPSAVGCTRRSANTTAYPYLRCMCSSLTTYLVTGMGCATTPSIDIQQTQPVLHPAEVPALFCEAVFILAVDLQHTRCPR